VMNQLNSYAVEGIFRSACAELVGEDLGGCRTGRMSMKRRGSSSDRVALGSDAAGEPREG